MKTIYIMWLRQLKRFMRSPARMIGALGQPLLFFLALGYGFGSIFQQAGKGNYIEFLAPGIMGMSIIFAAVFSGMDLIWDRQFGFLKETLVAPVGRFNIMMGRILGGATTAGGQGLLVLILAIVLGFRPYSLYTFPLVIVMALLVAFLFAAFGMLIGTLMRDMQGFPLVMNFVIMPLFFLSGAMFPLDTVPEALRIIATVDPLSYGVDALRLLLTGTSHFSIGLDIAVTVGVSFLFLLLGSMSFSRMQI
jgi:ABC-2 type transport system permease protein